MKLLSADCSFIGASVSPFDMSWLRTHLRKPLRRILLVGIVIIGATSLVTVLVTTLLRPPTLAHAQAALERKDYARAFELSEQILMNDRNSNEAKLIAGRAALGAGDNTLALQILRSIRDDGSDSSIEALLHCSQLAEKLGHLSEAEKFYRMLLRHRPEDLVANQGLVNLLRIEGRNWEARPAIYQLLRQRKFVFEYLAMAGPLEAVWLSADRDVPYLEYCGRVNPADQLYLLGPIRSVMMEENDFSPGIRGFLNRLTSIRRFGSTEHDGHAIKRTRKLQFDAWARQLRSIQTIGPQTY
jgi:tetratricopeptide (TPR) repeat protein